VAVHGNCLPSALARQRHQEQKWLPMAPEAIRSPSFLLLSLPMVFAFNPLGHFICIRSSGVPYGYPSPFRLLGDRWFLRSPFFIEGVDRMGRELV